MIELVSQSRCIQCNLCVEICPTNVFDPGSDGVPVLARHDDCQTCFLCEAYCPVDALYVAPEAHRHVQVDEETLVEANLLGSYRRSLGWGPGRHPGASLQKLYDLRTAIGSQGTLA